MSLLKLLSICCFIGIVFTAPGQLTFKRELEEFQKDLKTAENASKSCSEKKVEDIRFEANCTCAHYQEKFCQIKSILEQFSHTTCNGTFPKIQMAPALFGNTSNCSSSHQTLQDYVPFGNFFSKLENYVQSLINTCTGTRNSLYDCLQ